MSEYTCVAIPEAIFDSVDFNRLGTERLLKSNELVGRSGNLTFKQVKVDIIVDSSYEDEDENVTLYVNSEGLKLLTEEKIPFKIKAKNAKLPVRQTHIVNSAIWRSTHLNS